MDKEARELRVKRLMEDEHMSPCEAEFVMAIESGETDGDVVVVKDDSKARQGGTLEEKGVDA